MENKVLNFINGELTKYLEMPTEELFDEGELEQFKDSKVKKLVKKLNSFKSELIASHNSNLGLYNKACEDMNNIQEEIVGVIDGSDSGKTAMGYREFILVATTKNVYVYTREDTSKPGVLGVASIVTAVGSLISKEIKNKVNPFKKHTYTIDEFIETVKIGNAYSGFMDDFANWSYGIFFKKYYVHFIMRPMYRKLIDDMIKVQKGEYETKTKNFSIDVDGVNNADNCQQKQNDYIEELKKLKELLDLGIITQEEFDKKKKQLLD